ncbi:MAG: SDR family NAD(P)-dependent oxidoreductase [Deltaproteobacteria bacterium]|nr:SDR family NAD(P)-dependent oxidoreductase [Deltaproteobacteria bacterium]MBW2693650.1 SDR family NAD(P)-dependent oxidoreductase [Deltaproteobacteria bacterium]
MALLDGKVAIVTGSGGGIGREHALALAKEGAAVVVNDLGGARDGTGASQNMADQVVAEIKAAGGEAVANYDTVATVDGANNIVKTALSAFDKLDIVVNNAGILRDKSFAKMDEDMWDIVVEVHLRGTYCVTHAAYNQMKDRGEGGVIINTSSTSGLDGNFGQCNYGAAKAGIAGLTRCLAIEGKKYGIRTFILAPMALTRMTADLPILGDEKIKARMTPAVISPLVTYLASDLSKDQTGKTFFVGGGRIAEMKVVTCDGITKEEEGGLWTPAEIASKMLPGEILIAE